MWMLQLSATHKKECSLFSRSNPPPIINCLQYAKTEGEDLVNVTTWSTAHMMSQVLDTKTYSHIFSCREARETRQVLAKRQILPLEHNRVWSRTTEGWFCCKHCKSKSGFYCTMLAKFCHYGYFTHVVQQPFGASFQLGYVLYAWCCSISIGACLVFVSSIERKIILLRSTVIHISVTTCDACAVDHVVRFTSPFFHTASNKKLEVGKTWERG